MPAMRTFEKDVTEKTQLLTGWEGVAVSGASKAPQHFMRDIVAFYRHGHLLHAKAGTHCGTPIPIGETAVTAKPSAYDETRLELLERLRTQQAREAEADVAVDQQQSVAAPAAAPSAAPAPAE